MAQQVRIKNKEVKSFLTLLIGLCFSLYYGMTTTAIEHSNTLIRCNAIRVIIFYNGQGEK